MALVGDLVPIESRQVAIGRLLAVGLTGNLLGAVISGGIGDLLGWRGVFFSIGGFGLLTAVLAFFAFRGMNVGKPKAFNVAAAIAGFRGVFADPRAKICFGSVFFEGIVIHGMFPYVAVLLLAAGLTQSSYAGLVIGGFGLGGIIFALSLPFVVLHMTERQLILTGAAGAALCFILIALGLTWYIPGRRVRAFRFVVLHAAQQYPGSCDGPVADRARGSALAPLKRFLHRAGDRTDLLRLHFRPSWLAYPAIIRRRRDRDRRAGLRAVFAIPAANAGPDRIAAEAAVT